MEKSLKEGEDELIRKADGIVNNQKKDRYIAFRPNSYMHSYFKRAAG
jgi:hypothetical protein